MKKFRKALVALLALALVASCSSMLAFADGEQSSAFEYETVLEYYESETYLNATFDGSSNLNSALSDSSDSFSAVGKVSYVANSNGTATMRSLAPLYFDINTDKAVPFGANMKLSLDSASSVVSLRLNSSKRTNSNNDVLKLFEITQTAVSVFDGTENGVPKYKNVTLDGSDYAVGNAMFSIDLFLDTADAEDVAYLTVTADGKTSVSAEIKTGDFAFKAFDISSNYVTMDYCEIYQGSFARKLNDNKDDIVTLLNGIVAEYNKDTSNALAFDYLETVAKVVITYGFDDSRIADSARTALNVVAPVYAKTYNDGVAALDTSLAYNETLEAINELAYYGEFIDALSTSAYSAIEGIDYSKVSENKQKIDSEIARLAKAKEDTLISYSAVLSISNIYATSYADLKAVYDIVKEHPICETYSDDLYSQDSVALAYRFSNAIVTEFEKKDASAKAFINAVPVMANENLSFADRYEAYSIAKANKFSDTTYNAYLEGTTIENVIAKYDSVCADIQIVAEYAEEFLVKVKEAYLTSSYAVKIAALDVAALYIDDVERGYPGVPESIELYNTLRQDIADRIEATRNYINAVLAVMAAETVDEKKAAIEIAEAYAVLGSNVTVEITDMELTVTEANVILSNETSKILLGEATVNAYKQLVDSISEIVDVSARRTAINNALALKESVDQNAVGVAAANLVLDEAIADYNADVDAANSKSAEDNTLALNTISATAPTVSVAQVVAIIKKFFE